MKYEMQVPHKGIDREVLERETARLKHNAVDIIGGAERRLIARTHFGEGLQSTYNTILKPVC